MILFQVFTCNRSTVTITMAMMDDKLFLITHIRNSFITSDDTGMCELILDCDEAPGDRKHVTSAERRNKSWHDNK